MSNNDEIQIELGQSQRRHIEHKDSPLESSALCAVPYDQPSADKIPVFIAEHAMKAIERHTLGTKDREVGGVLLGGFFRNDKGSFIEISDFIEAKATRETDVSLTFTHETWEQINTEQAGRTDGAQIVGWYHSHPGLGVFMSREDEFIHSGYFTDPWQVAIVVDPIYHNWGCFKWVDGKLERTSGFYVYGNKKSAKSIKNYVDEIAQNRKAAPIAASASADRRPTIKSSGSSPAVWFIITLLIISQLITGFFALRKPAAETGAIDNAKIAAELLAHSNLTDAEHYLRAALIADPYNSAVYKQLSDLKTMQRTNVSDSGNLDSINLMLASAEKMANTKADADQATDGAYIPPDPVKNALEIYSEPNVISTRSARIKRAEVLTKQAKIKKPYEDAEKWLKEEHLRLIAFGLKTSPSDYLKQYKALGKSDKAVVDKCKSALGTVSAEELSK